MADSRTRVTGDDEDDLVAEIRDAFEYDVENWAPIREEANKDVAYCTGNTWDSADKALRKGRPMLSLDQLSQYLNQLENTVRQNKRAIKAAPAGNGATDETAQLRSNRIREIEYQSHAQEAYIQAFACCAMRSYGFGRIVAEYEDVESDNKVLRIKAIADPNQVVPDSDAESTSGRDWMRLTFVQTVSEREFKRDYPDAQIKDFAAYIGRPPYTRWIRQNRIQIAEFWKVNETPSAKGRPKREVCQYLTNGLELLSKKGQPKKTVWPGKYIPFFACLGKIIYLGNDAGDSEKVILSYVRLARDAAKLYNWIKSTEGEVMSMVPKTPYMAYQGSLDQTNLDNLVKSMYEQVPVVFAKAHDESTGQILPLPRREMIEPPVQAYEFAAESARRDVQNALGRYSVSDHGRLGNTKVTSGVALRELDKSGDLGSYHFIDHYDDMIMFCGEQLDDLLPYYDDTPKEIAVRLPDGTSKLQRINTPSQIDPMTGKPTFGPDDLRMDQGRHTITISTGPSFDSQREAGKDAAMTLLGNPQAFPIVAADAVRLMDLGPIGDQMAEDLEFIQPPQMQQARQQKNQKVDPAQLMAQLGKMKEQVGRAEQIMQAQHQELQGKQAEAQAKIDAAKVAAAKDVYLQKMRGAQAIAVAKIQLLGKGVIADHEAEVEAIALDHEAQQNDIEREHEMALHGASQAHDAGLQAMEHAHAGEMATLGHDQNLEAQQQAAALQPPPDSSAAPTA